MGEVYGLAALVIAAASAGWLATMAIFKKKPPNPNEGGTWRRTQETYAGRTGSRVRVLLVREHEGRETGRLLIAEISVGDDKWNELYLGAVAKADNDLALLESTERH